MAIRGLPEADGVVKVVFLIPSNKPDILLNYALSDASLCSLASLFNRHQACFSFALQPPFKSSDEIELAFNGYNAIWSATRMTQESPPRMPFLRQAAANLHRDADVYIWWDDNMVATHGTALYPRSSGERINEALDYMEKHPRCGILNMEGPRGGNYSEWKIKPSAARWWTARGLIIRNVFSGDLFHPGAMDLKGAFDDVMPGFKLVENGYYCAKQFNNPTRHCLRTNIGNAMKENDFGMHDVETNRANGEAFLANYYEEPGWTHLEKNPGTSNGFKPPRRLLTSYYANGGLEGIYPKVIREDLTVDYR